MKKCGLIIMLLSSISLFSVAQPKKEPTQPITRVDTVTTLCLVLTNVQAGSSQTMWLTKIYGTIYDFPTPKENELKSDSLTLKKQLIPIKSYYVNIQQEVVDPKTKKKTMQQQAKQIPEDLILLDFNNNYPKTSVANKPK